jgi:uncharacterized protein (DUF1778 family)
MASSKAKRTGIYIYCSDEEKQALKRAAKSARRTLSGFVMHQLAPYLAKPPRR